MTIDVFGWPLQVDGSGDVGYSTRVRSVTMGDGIEQVASDGINPTRATYNLKWKGNPEDTRAMKDFLNAHYVRAFVFTPPGGVKGLYRVKAETEVTDTFISTRVRGISATLVQAYGIEGA